MSNLTEYASHKSLRMLFCSRHWEEDGQVAYLFFWYHSFIVLYVLLSLVATSSNILILVALHKDASLHPPSKFLLRNMTFTDLCVGIIALPMSIMLLISTIGEHWELCYYIKYAVYVTSTTLSGVSLATLSAISVDRLLALLLRLRYRQVVTLKLVRMVVLFFWVGGITLGLIYTWSMQTFFIVAAVLIALQIGIPTYSYTRIFRTIHRQQTQVHGQANMTSAANMSKYKKTVTSALWVHLTLVTCYLPFAVATALTAIRGLNQNYFLAEGITASFVFINSSLNPALYCWKIKEVRQAAKETIKHICPCLSS